MATTLDTPTILVVDDDDVLGRVLSRVLTREGRNLVQAGSVAEAERLAGEHPPSLALLDLSLPDGDGVELARTLRQRYPAVPMILMTAYPLRLREHPDLTGQFTRVLTKPLNLQELRQAVDQALAEVPLADAPLADVPATPVRSAAQSTQAVVPVGEPSRSPVPAERAALAAATSSEPVQPFRPARLAVTAVVLLALLAGVVGVWKGWIHLPGQGAGESVRTVIEEPAHAVELVEKQPNTVQVADDARRTLGMVKADGSDNVAVVGPPAQGRPLTLYGDTALDTTRLVPIRIRFAPAEVLDVQAREDPRSAAATGQSVRELRTGDTVAKDQKLATLLSADVGNKKNDLAAALIQLRLDEDLLKRTEEASKRGAIPEVQLLQARRAVQADQNDINRAESTLRAWRIPAEDIDAVREEAKQLEQRGVRQISEDKIKEWARVVVTSPIAGTILERSIAPGIIINDNTTNLFQVGNLDRLAVRVRAPEDELPRLWNLDEEGRRMTIQTAGAAPVKGLEGFIDDVGYLIDPNEHTALVRGHVPNPEHRLRAGQYVTATIQLPPPKNVVEVPSTAVVEQGKQSLVFVQPEAGRPRYTMLRVRVTRRFEKTVLVSSKLSPEEQTLSREDQELGLLPPRPLPPGSRVLLSGTLELRAALEDEQAKVQSENK
jgi:cobalt-zinc-cadmium efflux system membrane fusion protein